MAFVWADFQLPGSKIERSMFLHIPGCLKRSGNAEYLNQFSLLEADLKCGWPLQLWYLRVNFDPDKEAAMAWDEATRAQHGRK